MSYWGLTVFSNIISTIPYFGNFLIYWLWGCEFINEDTLIKIHSLHVVFPLISLFFVFMHLFFLHYFLSSDSLDRYCFYLERCFFVYFFLFRDIGLFFYFFICFLFFSCVYWYFVFHEESWVCVEVTKTSEKVIPEWFFLMFFGVIKSVPDKFFGVLLLCVFFVFFVIVNFVFFVCFVLFTF